MLIKFFSKFLSSKVVATSDRIRYGYSNGSTDSNSPREWNKPN